jgi:hypothetical protein
MVRCVSIPVVLGAVASMVAGRTDGFLVSVDLSGAPRIRSVIPSIIEATFVVEVGSRTLSAVAANPSVTLVWPRYSDEHSLIVDGTATVKGRLVSIIASSAVLHRHATSSA